MSDDALVREILRQLLWSTEIIARRFAPIPTLPDFALSNHDLQKLDVTSTQLSENEV